MTRNGVVVCLALAGVTLASSCQKDVREQPKANPLTAAAASAPATMLRQSDASHSDHEPPRKVIRKPVPPPPDEAKVLSWLRSSKTPFSEVPGDCLVQYGQAGSAVSYVDQKWRNSPLARYVATRNKNETTFFCDPRSDRWECALGFSSSFAGGESAIIFRVNIAFEDGAISLARCEAAG